VSSRSNSRLVYSTGGEVCARCGRPVGDCACARTDAEEPVPEKIVARLRMERAGRGGKIVTVVDGLPRNEAFLKDLCAELKRACGTGGAVKDGTIELQGELRERVRELLLRKGHAVRG
jgi:translation initiation factor 1